MGMNFKEIEDFWFGDVKTPEFPFEPINIGTGFSDEDEKVGLVDPFEEPPSEETPEPERED